ncbi:MAG: hypothetical protein WD059_10620 [Balneolaceae bacterium]
MPFETSSNPDLDKLEKWLNYELSGSVLLALSFFYRFALYLFGIALLVFIPFLLNVLIKEKRYGWIITLFVLVLLPALVIYFMANSFYMHFIPIALFILYCFFLKMVIPNWRDPVFTKAT